MITSDYYPFTPPKQANVTYIKTIEQQQQQQKQQNICLPSISFSCPVVGVNVTINFISIYTGIIASVGLVKIVVSTVNSSPQSIVPPCQLDPPSQLVPSHSTKYLSPTTFTEYFPPLFRQKFVVKNFPPKKSSQDVPKLKIRYLHSLLGLVFS